MDIIMIPGLWLDGSSWSAVTPLLEQAGHRVRALTLPGKESRDADRSGIGLQDHVDFVVAAVDEAAEPVVLVGHSGGGLIAQLASDARPEKVARVVYVDAAPMPEGSLINDEIPIVDHELPLPDWGFFEDEDLVDLDEAMRERFREQAVPEPVGVAYDRSVFTSERRREVPTTIVCCEFPAKMIQEWIEQGAPFVREIKAMRHVEYVDLPTGHWPQFTKPAELGRILLEAVART
ncbi:MAG TPA: alpha/beta hydrolase [Glycomyces sp.]|nr:alpha/beta hydrolase [Glycomyces sp.]